MFVIAGRCLGGVRLLALVAVGVAFASWVPGTLAQQEPGGGYAGSALCGECHVQEHEAWRGSHHDLAMQPATEATVLGDFGDARFEYAGIESRFYRDGERFMVRTDGPDGELQDFEVRYTFGVDPLQQYLIPFGDGRLQALSIAWDSRPAEEGGQRWFHLYPDQSVTFDDELHWTRPSQNWNHMCAECHSTDLKKGFDAASNSFSTTWREIDVACEACHGPGQAHVEAARAGDGAGGLVVRLDERKGVEWTMDAASGIAKRSAPRTGEVEIQLCARCHSRRGIFSEDYVHGRHLMQTHRPALLEDGLYYADGQILDEVYVYGSFVQSRMYQAGVTCSDCHEPHSLKLRAEGDGVCLQCHAAGKYQVDAHHHHAEAEDGRGAACVDCHMPSRNYMVVDPRRDHSLRIPRPDLSARLDVPNACNGCHADKNADWAAASMDGWYGTAWRKPHFATAIAAGRRGDASALSDLLQLAADHTQPAIARGTALSLLRGRGNPETLSALRQGLDDPDPLVRLGVFGALEGVPPVTIYTLARTALDDAERGIRIEAARTMAMLRGELREPEAGQLEQAIAELEAEAALNADRAEALLNLGNFRARAGDLAGAERAFREAMARDERFVPAYVNLADLFRSMGQDGEGEMVLDDGLKRTAGHPTLHYAMGLLKVRQKDMPAALEHLAAASSGAPEQAHYAYVYALALDAAGQTAKAVLVLQGARARHPKDGALKQALSELSAKLDGP